MSPFFLNLHSSDGNTSQSATRKFILHRARKKIKKKENTAPETKELNPGRTPSRKRRTLLFYNHHPAQDGADSALGTQFPGAARPRWHCRHFPALGTQKFRTRAAQPRWCCRHFPALGTQQLSRAAQSRWHCRHFPSPSPGGARSPHGRGAHHRLTVPPGWP